MAPSHVLVALDGSPLSREALVHALETSDCRVTVLNAVTSLDESMSESGVIEPGEARREAADERAREAIEWAIERAAGTDHRIDVAVVTGDPVEAIQAYVESHDVDHVVVGGHGGRRNEVASRLLGTVATGVVSGTDVTVTVVR